MAEGREVVKDSRLRAVKGEVVEVPRDALQRKVRLQARAAMQKRKRTVIERLRRMVMMAERQSAGGRQQGADPETGMRRARLSRKRRRIEGNRIDVNRYSNKKNMPISKCRAIPVLSS